MADEAVRGTEYVVLEKRSAQSSEESQEHGTNTWWVELATLHARSARDAVAAYVKNDGSQGGSYVAVPTRSWAQIDVSVETQTRLTFS